MTGSVALDVVIGLVCIYSLYSLLTTTVTEIVASIIRLRASFLVRGIKRMLDDHITSTEFSDKFFKQPLIKYLGSGHLWGWVKKPSYLSAQNFSKALLEVLKEEGGAVLAKSTSGIEPTSLNKIREALINQPTANQTGQIIKVNNDTMKFIRSLLEDAQNDLEKFKASLEKWYDDTMERVTSWYKKWIQLITFFVGFAIAGLFNVDTIKIVQKLSHDPKAREQYINMAQKFIEDKEIARKIFADTTTQKNYDTLRQTLSDLRKQALVSNQVLSIKRDDFGFNQFLGWLITAIALSLGAPFWFDLLNKLMKLRSSIQAASPTQPEEAKQLVATVKRVG
jgi:hypothetical protein